VAAIDLLRSAEVPGDCAAVIVAGPTEQPSQAVITRLRDTLDDGGRLLVLADPAGSADLSAITQPLGIVLEKGLVLEGSDEHRPPDDPFRPIVSEYRSAHPVVQRLAPTVFPTVQGVLAEEGTRGGLTVTSLARTSELSFLERRPAEPRFDENEDLPGPIVVAAAADNSSNRDGAVTRSRVIVVGDSDFVSDDFLDAGANAAFVTRALDWLTLDEDIVSVEANIPALRPIELTEGRITYARMLGAGIVPALFLLGGAITWAVRRGR
jgi:ABC-type uncharacterized transport system involved in gliding motility auxiliary subunit